MTRRDDGAAGRRPDREAPELASMDMQQSALDAQIAAAASGLDLARHVVEIEEAGYTIVPGVFPPELCARAAAHMDEMLEGREALRVPGRGPAARSHPIPGNVKGQLFPAPALLAGAPALARAPQPELRLFEQVLLRTAPVPLEAQMMKEPGPTARGWHLDDVFAPEMFAATPRQTYFQMFAVLRDVLPGAGGTMVVPGSHRRVMAVAQRHSRGSDGRYDAEAWRACDRDKLMQEISTQPQDFGINLSEGIELPAAAGSLVVFCPSCLHSSSENRSETGASRYVVVQSFYHETDAALLQERYAEMRYLKGFHRDVHTSVPAVLRPMLHGRALWGEAMEDELAQFRAEDAGHFLSPQVVINRSSLHLIERLQTEMEPTLQGAGFHAGLNWPCVLFLNVFKAGGESLLSLVEDNANLALAAELLDLDEHLASTSGRTLDALVVSGCGLGDPAEWLKAPRGT